MMRPSAMMGSSVMVRRVVMPLWMMVVMRSRIVMSCAF